MTSHSRIELSDHMKARFKVARVIQFGLLNSTVIYGVLAHLVTKDQGETTPLSGDPEELQVMFSILGLGMCFCASMFNQFSLKRLQREERLRKRPIPESELDRLVGALFTGAVVTWALAESCAVFGLVLSFMLHEGSHYTLFGVLAFLTILAYPLSESSVRRVLETHR